MSRGVRSTPDMLRLSAAVSRPGIDPRIWCSLAYARADSVLDSEHGDILDVRLLPTELDVTVRVPQAYAGAGFGTNDGRILKDDELIVLFPDGDPATGGVVVARLWSASDTPPALAVDNPGDLVRVLAPGVGWRMKFSGEGGVFEVDAEGILRWTTTKDITFDTQTAWAAKAGTEARLEAPTVRAKASAKFVAETPAVRLGSDAAIHPLLLGDVYRTAETTKHSAETAGIATEVAGAALISAAGAQLAAAGALMILPVAGAMMAAPLVAAAGAQLTAGAASLSGGLGAVTAAISAFEAGTATYPSLVSKTD